MKFSERMGINSPKTLIQKDCMDIDLKNGLWNAYYDYFAINIFTSHRNTFELSEWYVLEQYWVNYWKFKKDEIPYSCDKIFYLLKDHFNKGTYYEVYEMIEYLFNFRGYFKHFEMATQINIVLKKELAGYRFIDGVFTPIIDDAEVTTITNVLEATKDNRLEFVHKHIRTAMEFLSNKENPDYRNSIKESISALESLSAVFNDSKPELAKNLQSLLTPLKLNGALVNGFTNLYGWTSNNKTGIRHSMMEEPNLDQEDAVYMLVSCSAFANYLIQKGVKAGIIN